MIFLRGDFDVVVHLVHLGLTGARYTDSLSCGEKPAEFSQHNTDSVW